MKTKKTTTNYKAALSFISTLPKLYLGQEVETTEGTGIIVSMNAGHNDDKLFNYEPTVKVWFEGYVGTYLISDIQPLAEKVKAVEQIESTEPEVKRATAGRPKKSTKE